MKLPELPEQLQWWIAMIDFVRDGTPLEEVIPQDCVGCVAWHGVAARDEKTARLLLEAELAAIGYRIVSVDELRPIADITEVPEELSGLRENLPNWMGESATVWGDLYPYSAESVE